MPYGAVYKISTPTTTLDHKNVYFSGAVAAWIGSGVVGYSGTGFKIGYITVRKMLIRTT